MGSKCFIFPLYMLGLSLLAHGAIGAAAAGLNGGNPGEGFWSSLISVGVGKALSINEVGTPGARTFAAGLVAAGIAKRTGGNPYFAASIAMLQHASNAEASKERAEAQKEAEPNFSPGPGLYERGDGMVLSLTVDNHGMLTDGNGTYYNYDYDYDTGTVGMGWTDGALEGVYPEILLVGGRSGYAIFREGKFLIGPRGPLFGNRYFTPNGAPGYFNKGYKRIGWSRYKGNGIDLRESTRRTSI